MAPQAIDNALSWRPSDFAVMIGLLMGSAIVAPHLDRMVIIEQLVGWAKSSAAAFMLAPTFPQFCRGAKAQSAGLGKALALYFGNRRRGTFIRDRR
jgi:hypothetical protein